MVAVSSVKTFKGGRKLNPMFPRKAEKYSPEAVVALLNLSIDHNRECLNVAVTVLTVFTSMRIEDVTGVYCDDIFKVPYQDGVPV